MGGAYLEIQRLDDPNAIHELEVLPLSAEDEVEHGDDGHHGGRHVQRADQPRLAATQHHNKMMNDNDDNNNQL